MFGVLEFFLGCEGAKQNWETHLFFHLPVSLRGVGRREGNENVGEVCAVLKLFSVEEISPAGIQPGYRNRSRAPGFRLRLPRECQVCKSNVSSISSRDLEGILIEM